MVKLYLKKILKICVFLHSNITEREWFMTLKNFYAKKHSGFQNWEKKIGELVSLDVEQDNQSWETVLVTKLGLCKQKNKNPKTII